MADVLITPASGKVEFKDASNNIDGLIELDGSGNLNISAPGGDLVLGDTTSDVYIGNGTNNIDIVFEQSGEIRGTTGTTLTIGSTVGGLQLRSSGTIPVNQQFQITSQGGINHVAHGTAAGATQAHQMRTAWTAAYDRWYLYPINSGSSAFNRELWYDFTNDKWSIEGPVEFPNDVVFKSNATVCSTFIAQTVQVNGSLTVGGQELLAANTVALGTLTGSQSTGTSASASFIMYDSAENVLFHKVLSTAPTPLGPNNTGDEIINASANTVTMLANLSHIEGHVTGATTLTLSFGDSKIGVSASTQTSGTLDIKANSITANEIAVGTLTADTLTVLAQDFVNPSSQTESLNGWGGSNEVTGGPASLNYLTYDSPENALQLDNNIGSASRITNVSMRSDTWLMDPNKVYRVNCKLKATGTTGLYYFGPSLYNAPTEGAVSNGGNGQGSVNWQPYNASRVAGTLDPNVYFATGAKSTISSDYVAFTAYIIGANRDINDVPDHDMSTGASYPYAKSTITKSSYAALRFLNWSSGTTVDTSLFIRDVSVQEVGTGTIVADNIKASAITAAKIQASAITAVKIDAQAITTDKIAASAITAVKIDADAITGDKISASTTIIAGTDTNIAGLDGSGTGDATVRIFAGSTLANKASAPFRVTQGGALTATNATITGAVTATSGTVGGWSIAASSLTAGSASANTTSGFTTANGIVLRKEGSIHSKEFYINSDGNAAFKGDLTAATGTFSGTISASAGSIGGWSIAASSLTAGSASASTASGFTTANGIVLRKEGSIHSKEFYINSDGNAAFKGDLTAATGTFSGTISASAGSIGGWSIAASSLTAGSASANTTSGYTTNNGIVLRKEGSIHSKQFYINSDGTAAFGGSLTSASVSAGNIVASAITAVKIDTGAITAGKIAASAITAGKIDTGAVTADKIASSSITTTKLVANAVTANELQISSSSSVASSMFFDGTNNRIDIKDSTGTLRVRIGKLT